MDTPQLSIVRRLPQSYRWRPGLTGLSVEPVAQNGTAGENNLVAIKLLSPNDEKAWPLMDKFRQTLSGIDIACTIIDYEGAPCLFVKRQDEFAAICRLKSFGVAIAEPFLTSEAI